MSRSDDEIRNEIERWKRVVLECRGHRERTADAAAAAVIVSALSWALGNTPTPTMRIKIS